VEELGYQGYAVTVVVPRWAALILALEIQRRTTPIEVEIVCEDVFEFLKEAPRTFAVVILLLDVRPHPELVREIAQRPGLLVLGVCAPKVGARKHGLFVQDYCGVVLQGCPGMRLVCDWAYRPPQAKTFAHLLVWEAGYAEMPLYRAQTIYTGPDALTLWVRWYGYDEITVEPLESFYVTER
jgi:hypothetical protein